MGQISQIGGNTLVDNVARQRLTEKQDILVSGETIKTINGISILGSGDLPAGLIDDIRINGVTIVANKIANIVVRSTLAADSNDLATITAIRDYVNSSINNLASYYITSDASGNAFSTKAALVAGPYYYAGSVRAVTKNDYAIVMTDESHDNKSARYVYTDNQWAFQYTFQMSFTQAQLSALNSGITAAAIALYDAHLSNTSNPHAVTKSQVGLGNVANERQYSSANPPPYPVTSVAGKTGAVTVTKTDVGLANVGNFKAVSTVASQGLTDAEKTNARNNIGAYSKPSTGIPASDINSSVLSAKQDVLTAGTGINGNYLSDEDKIEIDGTSVPVRSSWTAGAVPKKNANTGAWDEVQLANVATSGSYNDLSNKPTIPTDTNQKVKAGSVTFGANDVVDIVAGSNVTVTGDATNKKITISATDTTYESKTASSGGTAVSLVTTGEKYTWNNKGTYSKPSGGIPKTDLADAVKTSLGLADTALQSFTETDPTVPSWAKAPTKPTYTKSEVGLGNVGNFKAVSTVASQGLTDTEKSNARANIGAGTSSFSGNYNDLSNKPTIPAAQVNSDWNATSGKAQILNKPTLGALAGKSTVSNSDISGTISDVHIASASRWDGKQDAVTPGEGIDSYGFSEQGTLRVDDATVPYRESWSNNAVPVRNSSKDRWDEVQLGGLATKSTVSNSDISGTISDVHIASASRWDGKQDAVTPGEGIDSYGFSEQGTLRVDDATVPYRESWSNNAVPVRNSSKDRWDEVQLGGLATKSTVSQSDVDTALNTKIQNGNAAYQSVVAISNVIPDDATPSNMLVDQNSLDSQLPDTVNLVLNPLSDGTYNLTFTIS